MVREIKSKKPKMTVFPKPNSLRKQPKKEKKGRPMAEPQINMRKLEILIKKGLFYHQHREALINVNMKQYYLDPSLQPFDYIQKKIKGKIDLEALKNLLNSEQNKKGKDLESMIETALTLKNVEMRSQWQEIYLKIVKKMFKTKVTEVNCKSMMEAWGEELRETLQSDFCREIIINVSTKFPDDANVEDLILKESYCMLARYFHFQPNICKVDDNDKEKEKEKKKPKNTDNKKKYQIEYFEEVSGSSDEESYDEDRLFI